MATPIDMMLNGVEWVHNPDAAPDADSPDLPYATHSGVLTILDKQFRCYRLNDGRAIFDADDFANFFFDVAA